MRVRITHDRAVLEEYSMMEVQALRNGLSVKHPREFMLRAQRPYLNDPDKRWDGRIHFLKESSSGVWSFPSGLIERAQESINKQGGDFIIINPPKKGHIRPVYDLNGITLDQVQREALEALLENNKGTVQLSTGSGKTFLTAALANSWLTHHGTGKVLVLVPKKLLLKTTAKEIARVLDRKVGMLGDGHRDFDAEVLVATPNTASAPDRINGSMEIVQFLAKHVTAVIVDECHRSTSNMWQDAILNASRAEARWAMSGKVKYMADEYKEMQIEGLLGRPVYTGRNEKRLVPVTVLFYKHGAKKLPDHVSGQLLDGCIVKYSSNDKWVPAIYRGRDQDGNVKEDLLGEDGKADNSLFGIWTIPSRERPSFRLKPQPHRDDIVYQTAHDSGIMMCNIRNTWAMNLALTLCKDGRGNTKLPRGPVLITVKRARHAKMLFKTLKDIVPTVMVTGSLTGNQQQGAVKDFNSGKFSIMVAAAPVISEGVDIPNLLHVIKLDGLSGEQGLEQLKGRVERASDGKSGGYLHIPDDTHHYSLRKACMFMKKYYKASGLRVIT